jgi:hypothetical protein
MLVASKPSKQPLKIECMMKAKHTGFLVVSFLFILALLPTLYSFFTPVASIKLNTAVQACRWILLLGALGCSVFAVRIKCQGLLVYAVILAGYIFVYHFMGTHNVRYHPSTPTTAPITPVTH